MYHKITNPDTGRKVLVDSTSGRKILNNYIIKLSQLGGTKCSGIKMKICKDISDCNWGMPSGKKPNRCYELEPDNKIKEVKVKSKKNKHKQSAIMITEVNVNPTLTKQKTKVSKKSNSDNCLEASKQNGFTPSKIKKYQNRPSPPFPAANCPLEVKTGNDGKVYKSVPWGKSYAWRIKS